MTTQPVSAIFLCSALPSGAWRTPGLFIPRCCLAHTNKGLDQNNDTIANAFQHKNKNRTVACSSRKSLCNLAAEFYLTASRIKIRGRPNDSISISSDSLSSVRSLASHMQSSVDEVFPAVMRNCHINSKTTDRLRRSLQSPFLFFSFREWNS